MRKTVIPTPNKTIFPHFSLFIGGFWATLDKLLHLGKKNKFIYFVLRSIFRNFAANIYPNTMHRITLTYRHAAAPCPTLGGRTGETVVGGRSGAISTPPIY